MKVIVITSKEIIIAETPAHLMYHHNSDCVCVEVDIELLETGSTADAEEEDGSSSAEEEVGTSPFLAHSYLCPGIKESTTIKSWR